MGHSELEAVSEAGYALGSGRMLRLIAGSKQAGPSATEAARDELATLAHAVERGDRAALKTFLSALIPHLLRVARRVLGPSHPFVEDVAHDAAYAVVEQLPQFRGESSLLNFARRIAVLTAMNMRRRDAAQKRARLRDSADPDTLEAELESPEQRAQSGALLPVIRELMDELPDAQAEAFALNVILGYTAAEIAELSGAPLETVRSRLRLAKQTLKARALAHPLLQDSVEGQT
jgi:RNA polymerase sigma factor (sigma-70 family)